MQDGLNNYEIIVLNRAELEVDQIAEYYELISDELGVRFYIEYRNYVETLKTLPFFKVKYNIIRTLPLKKFPYTIHFTVNEEEKTVVIQAVTSNHQDPNSTRLKI